MVTFTLPYEMRQWVWYHQRVAYACLFKAATQTLNTFAKNDKKLTGDLGLTAVLHTHSRRLDYHPHIHLIVPSGAFHAKTACWHTKSAKFLFNEFAPKGINFSQSISGEVFCTTQTKENSMPESIA